ncbi:zinc finger and BTB domain-containing protein 32 [Enoplosus armatus]|uniref:zinc finger and BTB domain-containing protein 32 n=1 Tax=Enoplosus armatus TaxID=215367 RepID=UPI0039929400
MIQINNTQYFHFLQQADALRRSGSLCDAIISVKSQTFRAHRLVLACASRRLAQQLAREDIDSPVQCTLEYFSPRTFQQVLDFTYTQTIEVSVDDLHLLLRAAQLLEMQPLEDQCRQHLDNLHYRAREKSKGREIADIKEEEKSAEETDQKQKGSPVREENLQETSSPGDNASDSIVMENLSPSDPAKNRKSPLSPRKKARLSPVYHDVSKASTERVKDCRQCSDDPVLRESASTTSGEKPFECRLCGQRSRDYSAMIKHLRTHGGAAPYRCSACLEFCSSLVAMQRHVKSHAEQDFPPDWSINSTYLYKSHI